MRIYLNVFVQWIFNLNRFWRTAMHSENEVRCNRFTLSRMLKIAGNPAAHNPSVEKWAKKNSKTRDRKVRKIVTPLENICLKNLEKFRKVVACAKNNKNSDQNCKQKNGADGEADAFSEVLFRPLDLSDYYSETMLQINKKYDAMLRTTKSTKSYDKNDVFHKKASELQMACAVIRPDEGTVASKTLPNTKTITGDERLYWFKKTLDCFENPRLENQVEFHDMMIKTCLPAIYGEEWESDFDRILRSFDLDYHLSEAIMIAPRRFGKTWAVAMFAAVYVFMIPNAQITIFSVQQKTSYKMMVTIFLMMKELPFFATSAVDVKNADGITINTNGTLRRIACCSSTIAVCIFLRRFRFRFRFVGRTSSILFSFNFCRFHAC